MHPQALGTADGSSPGAATRVLFVTRKWPPTVGGMETYSVELVRHLRDLVDVEVLALPGPSREHPPGPSSLAGFLARAATHLVSARDLPDIVHIGDLAMWPLAALAAQRRPTFVSVHGSDAAFGTIPTAAGRAYRAYLTGGASLCRQVRVIPNSRATAALTQDLGYRMQRPVLLGADTTSVPPPNLDATPEPFVLFTGRLMQRKGLAWFVEQVLDRLPRLRLVAAGPRWDAAEERVLDHSRVDWVGPKSRVELRDLRERAVATVVPNRAEVDRGATAFEGFGLVAVEAAIDGAVVVASAVHGLCDAVIDGETGFLVAAEDADAWVRRLQAIVDWSPSQRRDFRARSTDRARAVFDWARVSRDVAALYEAALADPEVGSTGGGRHA